MLACQLTGQLGRKSQKGMAPELRNTTGYMMD
ncbi:hypothetical protein CTB91_03256 [Dickeya solani]|uniref:Transposase n=1 Tax=Dickeya solani D s0432-1 TaxID=1231725 RepID=A0AAV3K810_9GAMM|nr:hypothetical protein CTB91_03256 [Dickeya solani]ERO56620.1 hypothetical protein A544_3185 [Dickeya solani D s0432-1]AYQ53182.1 hypothetical protein DSOL99_03253 [Dickeya solani]NUA40966.1 hypothetical protein [Dickeya solani]NUA43226.1 hypothetical protein [Dickeya solani]